MDTLAIIVSCIALAAVVVLGLLIWSRLKELAAKPASDGIQIMQQQVDSLRQQTQGSLENMNASLLKTLTAKLPPVTLDFVTFGFVKVPLRF